MAWCSWEGAIRRFVYSRGAALKDGKQHPTQKPEEVMVWCINQLPKRPKTILDPFMGSGTTLVSAKRLGYSAIGIEIEERYCEIAAKRLEQEVLPLEMGA
jgi:DNA modification methylase